MSKKSPVNPEESKNLKEKNQENLEEDPEKDVKTNEKKENKESKFQSLPLREYYDHEVTSVLLEGLRELGRQRFLTLFY